MVSIYLLCWFSFVLILAGSLFHDVISGHPGHDNCNHDLDTQNVSITLEWVNHFGCFLGGRCKSGRWKCVQAGEKNSRNIDKDMAYFWKSVRVMIIYSKQMVWSLNHLELKGSEKKNNKEKSQRVWKFWNHFENFNPVLSFCCFKIGKMILENSKKNAGEWVHCFVKRALGQLSNALWERVADLNGVTCFDYFDYFGLLLNVWTWRDEEQIQTSQSRKYLQGNVERVRWKNERGKEMGSHHIWAIIG